MDAERLRAALSTIASTSPCVLRPGSEDQHSCKMCLALINEARDALGYQRWPAIPATLTEKKEP